MVECSAIYDSACVSTRKMKLRVQQFLLAAAFLAQALLTDGKGKNYYSTLGLKKNAKDNAIKKAYRCVSAVRSTSHGLPVLLSAVYSQPYDQYCCSFFRSHFSRLSSRFERTIDDRCSR